MKQKTIRDRLRDVLFAMRSRCYKPHNASYARYGGVGITVCDEWLTSVDEFVKWSLANGYRPGLSIDRINNRDGYSPSNCRWATVSQQQINKRYRRSGKSGQFRGVKKTRDTWLARIRREGKVFVIGRFDTAVEAALAYDDAAIRQQGEFARLNFPERYKNKTRMTVSLE